MGYKLTTRHQFRNFVAEMSDSEGERTPRYVSGLIDDVQDTETTPGNSIREDGSPLLQDASPDPWSEDADMPWEEFERRFLYGNIFEAAIQERIEERIMNNEMDVDSEPGTPIPIPRMEPGMALPHYFEEQGIRVFCAHCERDCSQFLCNCNFGLIIQNFAGDRLFL